MLSSGLERLFMVISFCHWTHFSSSACERNNPAMVATLLNHGVAVNAHCIQGWTALQEAVCRNNIEICEMLLKAGAKHNLTNIYGISPLFTAAQSGQLAALRFLLKHGTWKIILFSPLLLTAICCSPTCTTPCCCLRHIREGISASCASSSNTVHEDCLSELSPKLLHLKLVGHCKIISCQSNLNH